MIKRLPIYHQLLSTNKTTSQGVFLKALNISIPTFKRDLATLRKSFNIPVMYSTWDRGYYLADKKVFDYIFNQKALTWTSARGAVKI